MSTVNKVHWPFSSFGHIVKGELTSEISSVIQACKTIFTLTLSITFSNYTIVNSFLSYKRTSHKTHKHTRENEDIWISTVSIFPIVVSFRTWIYLHKKYNSHQQAVLTEFKNKVVTLHWYLNPETQYTD